uniref:Ig-like domain-containing protein n=1 Tax=Salarias fasciatus TaxID=181472 RepID=A0A672HFF3_SALFA
MGSLMDNVHLMASFSPLFPGLTAADTISPDRQEVSGREGQSVTLSCSYQTGSSGVYLFWYRHHSDLQAPQFILWKGAKSWSGEHIPDGRYGSQTTASSTTLKEAQLNSTDQLKGTLIGWFCSLVFNF